MGEQTAGGDWTGECGALPLIMFHNVDTRMIEVIKGEDKIELVLGWVKKVI